MARRVEAEQMLAEFAVVFSLLGMLLFCYSVHQSFSPVDGRENPYLHADNFISLIARSEPLDAAAMHVIDAWASVPLFALACIFYAKRPIWIAKAMPWVYLAAFVPEIWCHYGYMPAHITEMGAGQAYFLSGWVSYTALFLGIGSATLLVIVVLVEHVHRFESVMENGSDIEASTKTELTASIERIERILSGTAITLCTIGALLSCFMLSVSFFEIRDWPDSTLYFRSSNFISLIAQSKQLDGIAYITLDTWCAIPLFLLACTSYAKNPEWIMKAMPWVYGIAFIPGIWSHLIYMPAHGGVRIGQPFFWGSCQFLLAGMALGLLLAIAIWLRRKSADIAALENQRVPSDEAPPQEIGKP